MKLQAKALHQEEVQLLLIAGQWEYRLGLWLLTFLPTKEAGMRDGKSFQLGQKKEWNTKIFFWI